MSKFILFLLLPLILFGGNLSFKDGIIQAHTEVFGDSAIEPSVKNIHTSLSVKNNDLNSLKGSISFKLLDFKSTNRSRDEHMLEMFEASTFNTVSLTIHNVRQKNSIYILDTTLTMHGVNKDLEIPAKITNNNTTLTLNANFSVKVSDYAMEPPSLLFFTVKDKVNIKANIILLKQSI